MLRARTHGHRLNGQRSASMPKVLLNGTQGTQWIVISFAQLSSQEDLLPGNAWELRSAEVSCWVVFFGEVLITEITQWWVHAKSWIILWKPTSRPARGVPKVEARPSTSSLGGLHPYLLCKSLSAGYLINADIGNPPECSWIFAKMGLHWGVDWCSPHVWWLTSHHPHIVWKTSCGLMVLHPRFCALYGYTHRHTHTHIYIYIMLCIYIYVILYIYCVLKYVCNIIYIILNYIKLYYNILLYYIKLNCVILYIYIYLLYIKLNYITY